MTAHRHRCRRLRSLLIILVWPLLSACAGAYFKPAGSPPESPPQYTLQTLPFDEYWTGLVFNGNKIGFTHFRLTPTLPGNPGYQVQSEAVMHFRFLGVDKKVTLKARDRIASDLTLLDFAYDYDLDGTQMNIQGSLHDDVVKARIISAGEETLQSYPVNGKIYSTSVIALYPVLHGLEVGREFSYSVYDGETRSVAEVRQKVIAYEHSELFEGPAFRLRTWLHGQEVDTWIDDSGRPVLEMSLGGVFIAGLENEDMARRYLTLAALNKSESLLDFSRIPAKPAIARPRSVTGLELELSGLGEFAVPDDSLQRCRRSGGLTICRTGERDGAGTAPENASRYLRSTLPVPSRAPAIRELAKSITRDIENDSERIGFLVEWIEKNIDQAPVDVFSALDVLEKRKAECQGNAYLYAALARALGIPTRVVSGIVYSEAGEGFLYHTWAESFVAGRWIAVDPTFGQPEADATHLKLIEGETLAELGPLTRFMGRVKARVRKVSY